MKWSEKQSCQGEWISGEVRHHSGQNSSAKLSDEWDGSVASNPRGVLGSHLAATSHSKRPVTKSTNSDEKRTEDQGREPVQEQGLSHSPHGEKMNRSEDWVQWLFPLEDGTQSLESTVWCRHANGPTSWGKEDTWREVLYILRPHRVETLPFRNLTEGAGRLLMKVYTCCHWIFMTPGKPSDFQGSLWTS